MYIKDYIVKHSREVCVLNKKTLFEDLMNNKTLSKDLNQQS